VADSGKKVSNSGHIRKVGKYCGRNSALGNRDAKGYSERFTTLPLLLVTQFGLPRHQYAMQKLPCLA